MILDELIKTYLIKKKKYSAFESPTGEMLSIFSLPPFFKFIFQKIKNNEYGHYEKITNYLSKKILLIYKYLDVES